MTNDNLEHIFDPQAMEYGSETGNWFGKCKDCGTGLVVYTGERAVRPEGAKREEMIHSNGSWEGREVLWFSFEEFVAGNPNMLVRYLACGTEEGKTDG